MGHPINETASSTWRAMQTTGSTVLTKTSNINISLWQHIQEVNGSDLVSVIGVSDKQPSLSVQISQILFAYTTLSLSRWYKLESRTRILAYLFPYIITTKLWLKVTLTWSTMEDGNGDEEAIINPPSIQRVFIEVSRGTWVLICSKGLDCQFTLNKDRYLMLKHWYRGCQHSKSSA